MHCIRAADDERGSNSIRPNAEALVLSEGNASFLPDMGIKKVDFSATDLIKRDWDVVVTNPALLCKDRLF